MKSFLKTSDADNVIAGLMRSQAVIEFKPDGTITKANENFLTAVGYKLEEIAGQHHSLFMGKEDAAGEDYKKFWESLASGEFQSGEFRRFGKGGNEIWIQATYNPIVDKAGKVYKVVKFASDITQHKLQAADFENQIAAIGRSQAVIEFELDGTILRANENFTSTVGYSLEEIQGQHHKIFVDPSESSTAEYENFWNDLREGKFKSGEFKRFGKGQKEIWIQATYNPICDMNGVPFKVVKYASDITDMVLERTRRREAMQKIDDQLSEIVSIVEKSTEQATQAEQATSQTSSNVQNVAASAGQLTTSVSEISSQVTSARDITTSAVKEAEETNKTISSLAEAAQTIGQVVELISGIAEQTNLLALNATIEAARAGEAGKGFAVVASEVKTLANQTASATNEISEQISGIQGATEKAVDAIGIISQTVGKINEIAASIANAVEEQSAVSSEITENMQTAASGVDTIAHSITDIAKATREVNDATRSVKEASLAIA